MEVLSRRDFIMTAGAAAGCATSPTARNEMCAGEFDEHSAVLVSDTHVGKSGSRHRIEAFEWTIREILAMRSLPRHLIHFGDMSLLTGKVEDYAISKPLLDRVRAAGIHVTVAMGNHDRRSAYLEVFGDEVARQSPVPGRLVSVVEMPEVGIVMLDSLAGKDDVEKRPVDGDLSKEQQDWLMAFLSKRTKPVIVAAHHPMDQLKVGERQIAYSIVYNPAVVGFMHGHWHSWMRGWINAEWKTHSMLHSIGLPSCGCDGDIGYCMMRTFPDRVEVELRQRDFYLPGPYRGKDRPPQWDRRVAENMASPVSIHFNTF